MAARWISGSHGLRDVPGVSPRELHSPVGVGGSSYDIISLMDVLMAVPAMVWLLISALFFAFGEFLSKKFALAPSLSYVFAIVIIYSLGTLAWLPAILQKKQLSITGAIWSVLSLLATVLIGVIIFRERLNVLTVAGIILGAMAIALLSIA